MATGPIRRIENLLRGDVEDAGTDDHRLVCSQFPLRLIVCSPYQPNLPLPCENLLISEVKIHKVAETSSEAGDTGMLGSEFDM